ncbi:HFL045Cp [Eremothecium sinecaudum]|uniref:HFL045Cp n=1 Tax=Eremothecium sinecaudum TaxID=45286 RepID=A0A120K2K4_9SACH|nr:HFL045Cp [Eremothecium sinecaudum]AMD21811.1 HFL045Cp [Eremothecium sinecaudum]
MSGGKYKPLDKPADKSLDSDNVLFSMDDDNISINQEIDTSPVDVNVRQKQPSEPARGLFNTIAPYYQVGDDQLYHQVVSGLSLKKVKNLEAGPNTNIEIYSTFWIIMTGVLSLYVSYCGKNLLTEFINGRRITDQKGNYGVLISMLWLLSIYVVLIPVCLKMFVTYVFNQVIGGLELIQWYGLSCIVWIPISILSIMTAFLPGNWAAVLEWILVALGGAYGCGIIFAQIQEDLNEIPQKKVISLIVVALHTLFVLIIKFAIF